MRIDLGPAAVHLRLWQVCLAALLALLGGQSPLAAVELVSGVSDPAYLGSTANGTSDGVGRAALSADGRLVAFTSLAPNLVGGDANATCDVFVRDLLAGTTARASTGTAGAEGDGCSDEGALSADGRFVAFTSAATNLVVGDTNRATDVFRKDLQAGTLVRVSTRSGGAQAYGGRSRQAALSADGRFVAFASYATDLVPGDADGLDDVYVKDVVTGTTVCASTSSDGVRANNWSRSPSLSADGRYVAFESGAWNLTAGDEVPNGDIFVKDLQTGVLVCASTTPDGAQADGNSGEPFLSPDGRYVTFRSDATNLAGGCSDLYVKDLQTGAVACASTNAEGVAANALCTQASSNDGRHVVFRSAATNLVEGTTMARLRVYLKDLVTGGVAILSADGAGVPADDDSGSPAISADGGRVAFASRDARLVAGDGNGVADVFVKDTATGSLALASPRDTSVALLLSVPGDSQSAGLAASADGRSVLFTSRAATLVDGDTNGTWDAFVRDMQTGATTRVGTDSAGAQADGAVSGCAISGDGRYALFSSYAANLVAGDTNATADIFVKDLRTGATTRVSTDGAGAQADGGSTCGGISHDGRFVTFSSLATNLVPDDTNGKSDIFVKDRLSGATTLASTDTGGAQADGDSYYPALSGDGRFVAFRSAAGNLVAGDTGAFDVFVKDRETGATVRASTSSAGAQADGSSDRPALSGDGRFVVFVSAASNLAGGDTNGRQDVFVKDLQTGETRIASTGTGGERAGLDCASPAISADGRYVVFSSGSAGLAVNDTNIHADVFLKDLQLGTLDLMSVGRAGEAGNGAATSPAISGDGRQVVFTSAATNLVSGDGNAALDVFRSAVSSNLQVGVSGTAGATAGKKASFWITFVAAGPNTAQAVSVIASVPAGSTFADAWADRPGWTISAPAPGGTGPIVFSRPYATIGVQHKLTVLLDVDADAEEGAALTLEATAGGLPPDPNPGNDTASWTETVGCAADLAVGLSAPPAVGPGAEYDVLVTLTNGGPSLARDLVLETALPAGAGFVSQAQTAGPSFSLGSGSPLRNTAVSLAPGAAAVFRVTLRAGADLEAGTVLATSATVAAATGDPPPGNANNAATATTTVSEAGGPPEAFAKSAPADGATGQATNPMLHWGRSNGATSYEYCYDTTDDNACSGSWTGTDTESVLLPVLARYTTYYWQVRAVNEFGTTCADGSSAAFWSFTTAEGFSKVSPAQGATGVSTSPVLSWTGSAGAASYQYCIDTTDDGACTGWKPPSPPGARSVVVTGLAPHTRYFWHVAASYGEGSTVYGDGGAAAFWSFTTGNLPPVLGLVGDKTSAEGSLLSFTLSASDPDSSALTFSAAGLPTGATLDADTGEFRWTPGYCQANEYVVTFAVGDGELTDSEAITITVLDPAGPIFFDDFADGAAPEDWRRVRGDWAGSGGGYTTRSLTTNNLAQVVPLDPVALPLGAGVVQARVKLGPAASGAGPSGVLVFGYRDPTHYRWARITRTEVQIGQTGTMDGIRGGIKRRVTRSHAVGRFVLLTVRIHPSGWVRVHEGTATTPVASYRFLSGARPSVVTGGVGLAAAKTRTVFDNVKVWEDSALAPQGAGAPQAGKRLLQ